MFEVGEGDGFYSGLFKMPIQKGSQCNIKVLPSSKLSYYIGLLRKQDKHRHGFTLFISACRAPSITQIDLVSNDTMISKQSTYEEYRRIAFENPLSNKWYGMGFNMNYLLALINAIENDSRRGDLGCIGNLTKDSCNDLDYKQYYLEKYGLTNTDVDGNYFEMMGIDINNKEVANAAYEEETKAMEETKAILLENKKRKTHKAKLAAEYRDTVKDGWN